MPVKTNRKARREALKHARSREAGPKLTRRRSTLLEYNGNLEKMRKAWGFAGFKG
jgi:hypothetical protein